MQQEMRGCTHDLSSSPFGFAFRTCSDCGVATAKDGPTINVAITNRVHASIPRPLQVNNMLVSVVIPTVDRKDELIRAIRGAADQQIDFALLEILVVDNSSNARQREVVVPLLHTIQRAKKYTLHT